MVFDFGPNTNQRVFCSVTIFRVGDRQLYTTTLRAYFLISDLTHPFLQTWVVAEGPLAWQAPTLGTVMLAMVPLQVQDYPRSRPSTYSCVRLSC